MMFYDAGPLIRLSLFAHYQYLWHFHRHIPFRSAHSLDGFP